MFNSKEKLRAYHKKWYRKNKARRLEINNAYKAKRREWFKEYKKTLKCIRCGHADYRCLQFHHRDPKTKIYEIANRYKSLCEATIMKEINKCDVLCANCHFSEHYTE